MPIKKVALSRDENFHMESNDLIVCLFQGHNACGDSRRRNSRSYYLYQKSASRCIKYMGMKLLVATGSFNRMAPSHTSHHLSTQRRMSRDNFPSVLDNDCWPLNSPDWNPLD